MREEGSRKEWGEKAAARGRKRRGRNERREKKGEKRK